MNRLIIIGNGFDLAHGLKTRYEDFIFDYLKKAAKRVFANESQRLNEESWGYIYEDDLISISTIRTIPVKYYNELIEEINSTADLIHFLKINYFNVNIKFSLLNRFLNSNTIKWVDFEIEYFNELKKILNGLGKQDKNYDFKINELNHQFEILKQYLIEYLKEQESSFSNQFDLSLYGDFFSQPIKYNEVTIESINDLLPNELLFLSFNYTNTIREYIQYCKQKGIKYQLNYIHGKLNDSENSIIFGFGDEYDQKYVELEHLNDNKLFEHIKSFGYLKTDNYANLTRFVNAEKFQVHIYGHSCGLSDRTMFKEIFEHENCKSIKIFYHQRPDGSNDFTDKCYDIYRHFTNKNLMRNKVVNERYLIPMPQI